LSSEPHRRPGFVLLEAVVALAIIGLFAVALLSATGSQLRTASKANVLLQARSLAEDRITSLRLLDYDALSDLPDSLVEGRFPEPFDDFTWKATVEVMEDEYDLFGAQVVVEGRGESFPLSTLLHAPRPVLGGAAGGPAGGGGQRGDPTVRGSAPEPEFGQRGNRGQRGGQRTGRRGGGG
jgi:type II secretory pathway pseudopilin PulG